MRVLVPFDSHEPNTRLRSVFSAEERHEFAAVMRRQVLETVQQAGHDPELLATTPLDSEWPVHVDDRPLSRAVNSVLDETTDPIAVVMADLALARAESIERLIAPTAAIVLAPGLGGGTNAVVIREPAFRVDYHGASYRKHIKAADQCSGTVETVDSFRLSVDIDEPADLIELLVHGTGPSSAWLRDAGFAVETTEGRCLLQRDGEPVAHTGDT